MDEDGATVQDRPVDGVTRPGERWRSRPLRGLDELLDDLLGMSSEIDRRPSVGPADHPVVR